MIYAISNSLLYVCFAIVIGICLLSLVPEDKKPKLVLPKKWLAGSVLCIPVLAIIPVLDLAFSVNGYREEFILASFFYVLQHIEAGRAWTALLFFSIIFLVLIWMMCKQLSSSNVYLFGLLLAFGMIVTQGVVGHSANMGSYPGATSHILHLLAVSCWVGALFVVSWFSNNDDNWHHFIDWFTPVAFTCVITVSFSGVFMTFFLTESIFNSWMLTYGQALLLKHLLFIPLLVFASINGFFIRKKIKQMPNLSPRRWWRAESIIILTIFVVTGFMSEQEPPHNIAHTLNREDSSVLFQSLVSFPIGPDTELFFQPDWLSLIFLVVGIVFLLLVIYAFNQGFSPIGAVISGILAVSSMYLGIINNVEPEFRMEALQETVSYGVLFFNRKVNPVFPKHIES
ncbi:copper resistance D family protein [Alteribacillus sp. JSM 102045]|uniref:copper resistance D family protein n=1 Tax=Alteribacillus sp. JSM 102045 TaxID=1562101 RepID=UPI0035C0A0C4